MSCLLECWDSHGIYYGVMESRPENKVTGVIDGDNSLSTLKVITGMGEGGLDGIPAEWKKWFGPEGKPASGARRVRPKFDCEWNRPSGECETAARTAMAGFDVLASIGIERAEARDGTVGFLHSGDMGDIVAGLAAVREVAECSTSGKARVLLDVSGGLKVNGDRAIDELIRLTTGGLGTKLNSRSAAFLLPLIQAQPYVSEARVFDPQADRGLVDINLNLFRYLSSNRAFAKWLSGNLMLCQQVAAGCRPRDVGPWLSFGGEYNRAAYRERLQGRRIAVCRSTRCQSCQILHSSMSVVYQNLGFFVGTDLEYEAFLDCTRAKREALPKVEVSDALDLARVFREAGVVVSNSTLGYWVAVASGCPVVCELPGSVDLQNIVLPRLCKVYVRCDEPHVLGPEGPMEGFDLRRTMAMVVGLAKNGQGTAAQPSGN